MIACNFFVVVAYLVGALMGLKMADEDVMTDTSIYTQGILDWESRFWIDFIWSADSCPADYEAVGNWWQGTVEGNYTDNGVEKTDPRWDGEIKVKPAVY